MPTERLVQKVQLANNEQTIAIKGIGYELEPLIIIANQDKQTKMSIDLTSFDQPDGSFLIMNADTKQIVTEFNGTKGSVEVDFTVEKAGTYGIYLNEDELLGVIDVVNDLNTANPEDIRSKYLQ